MSSNLIKILIGIGVLVGLYFGYVFFITAPAVTPEEETNTSQVGQEILVMIERLHHISLDPSIFSSPIILRLKDSVIPLTFEAQGRSDPFSSIGVQGGSVSTEARKASSTASTR